MAVVPRRRVSSCSTCFFFYDTATTEIYTLSLHDALPISVGRELARRRRLLRLYLLLLLVPLGIAAWFLVAGRSDQDRKSTRLNSSHGYISYAVFCLKKKNKIQVNDTSPTYKLTRIAVVPS